MRASSTCNIGKTADLYILKNINIDKTLRFMLSAFESFQRTNTLLLLLKCTYSSHNPGNFNIEQLWHVADKSLRYIIFENSSFSKNSK